MLLPEQSTVRVRITVSFDVGNGVGSFDYNTSGYLQINLHSLLVFSIIQYWECVNQMLCQIS